jgi:hypothetical protein
MVKVWRIGQHEVRWEDATGIIVLVHVGTMDADEIRAISDAMDECVGLGPPGDPSLLLVDSRRATGLNVSGREVAASKAKVARADTLVAVFGAPFTYRVVLNLVFRGVALVTDKLRATAVSEEAEARAWLTNGRLAYLASRETR